KQLGKLYHFPLTPYIASNMTPITCSAMHPGFRMRKMARECLQANRPSMFGFDSRSGGWSSIAASVGRRFTPVGNCYVLKLKQRRQYEKQNDETSETDSLVDRSNQAATSTTDCPHDGTRNTGHL